MSVSSVITSGKEFHDDTFNGETFLEVEWNKKIFEACRFEKCIFDTVKWKQCRFEQCRFQDCRLLSVQPNGTRFHDTRFNRCKLAGINFAVLDFSLFFSIEVLDCMLLSCSFPHIDMTKSRLIGNVFEDCMFENANMRGMDLSGTNFGGSRFRQCNLQGSNFSDTTGFIIDPRENNMTKARFTMGSALELLRTFDIILE